MLEITAHGVPGAEIYLITHMGNVWRDPSTWAQSSLYGRPVAYYLHTLFRSKMERPLPKPFTASAVARGFRLTNQPSKATEPVQDSFQFAAYRVLLGMLICCLNVVAMISTLSQCKDAEWQMLPVVCRISSRFSKWMRFSTYPEQTRRKSIPSVKARLARTWLGSSNDCPWADRAGA